MKPNKGLPRKRKIREILCKSCKNREAVCSIRLCMPCLSTKFDEPRKRIIIENKVFDLYPTFATHPAFSYLKDEEKTKDITSPRKRRMLPTYGKLLVDNVAGIPNEGTVRVMPENRIYHYSGVVPTRKRRMKEKFVGEIKYHGLKIRPNWYEKIRISIFNWLACGFVKIDL